MQPQRKAAPYKPTAPASARSGATPLPNRQPKTARPSPWPGLGRWLLRLVGLSLLAGLGYGGFYAWQQLNVKAKLDQFMDRPIAGVSVESEFKYISQADTQTTVASRLTKTFLDLDMQGIKTALEANPWVDSVMVMRRWPDRLVVHIEEQKPIARWGDKGFLNMRGEIIEVPPNPVLDSLPLFLADPQYAKEVMQHYLLVKNFASQANLTPQMLALDNTKSWRIQFTSGLIITLGREKPLEKLKNISKILRTELVSELKHIKSVDMRYENGFAVAWKDESPPPSVVPQAAKKEDPTPTDTSQFSAE